MKKVLIVFGFLLFSSQIFAQIETPLAKKPKKTPVNKQKETAVSKTETPSVTKEKEVPKVEEAEVAVKKPKKKKSPKDGFAERLDVDSLSLVPFPDVRDEDVIYRKRLWREIDLRDTINATFRANQSNLMGVFVAAIKSEELTAYSPKGVGEKSLDDDDSFQTPLTSLEAIKAVVGSVQITDNNTGSVKDTLNDYNGDLFLKFRLKEDWILDQKRSVFEARIVGIAPLKLDEKTNNWQPIFWINYNDARELLSRKRIVNSRNDASILTFDDVFLRRIFASNIIKETNPGDNKIRDLISDPKLRLYESERIKSGLLNFEQSLWEY
ncbi:MAG: gliding motility protein GldN [Sphingobacteriaceae bacterium]|nr:gliding motility protein GldN [Sphingobacteriaceae bacterium]